jgi:hypothetical protein
MRNTSSMITECMFFLKMYQTAKRIHNSTKAAEGIQKQTNKQNECWRLRSKSRYGRRHLSSNIPRAELSRRGPSRTLQPNLLGIYGEATDATILLLLKGYSKSCWTPRLRVSHSGQDKHDGTRYNVITGRRTQAALRLEH